MVVKAVVTVGGLMPPIDRFTSLGALLQSVENVGRHDDALSSKATCHLCVLGQLVSLVVTGFGKPIDYDLRAIFVPFVQVAVIWILYWTHIDHGNPLAVLTFVSCCRRRRGR